MATATTNKSAFELNMEKMASMKSTSVKKNVGSAVTESSKFVVSTLKTINLEMDLYRSERFEELEPNELNALAIMRANGL